MAIKIEETNNYYKVEFDECKIMGLSVYVVFSVYCSPDEREKEKLMRPRYIEFFNKAQAEINRNYQALLDGVSKTGKTAEEIVDEDGLVLAEYAELRKLQDRVNNLNQTLMSIDQHLYKYGEGQLPEVEFIVPSAELTGEFGFDEQWTNSPVALSKKAEIYCGEYDGEAISHEFYYDRFKGVLVGTQVDC